MSNADIDRLARLLEGEVADADLDAEEQQLSSLATLLREASPEVPPMRAEFRAELRMQVLEAARQRRAEPALMTRIRDRVQRMKYSTGLAGATGMASVALAGGGVAGAAEHAQPGELLYPAKIAIEDVRLLATRDEVARGQRAMSYAADRVAEAELAADEADHERAAVALDGASTRTREGRDAITGSGDDAAMLDLADALQAQEAAVRTLLPRLDGTAVDAAQALLREVDAARAAIGAALGRPVEGPGGPGSPIIVTPTPAGPTPGAESSPAPAAPPASPPAAATPQPTPQPQPDDPGLPDPVPGVQIPDLDAPDLGAPPAAPGPQDPALPAPSLPTSVLPTAVPSLLEGVFDGASGAVDALPPASGVVEQVIEGVIAPAAPAAAPVVEDVVAPVQGAVDQVQGTVEGLLGGR